MPESMTKDAVLQCPSKAVWTEWLAANHEVASGVWLRLAKKTADIPSVTYAEALDVALCHGWIDSQKKADDAHFWLQRFTPRSAKSIWSKVNRDKALALIANGEMKAAGLKEVERARADGRWDAAYDSPRTAAIPDDFQAALDGNAEAKAFFASLNGQNRYAFLFRIQTAKKPETRASRIEKFVTMLANHEQLHP